MKQILLLFGFSYSLNALAWTHRPEVGLGYTSNANYEETSVDSDLYLWFKNLSYQSWTERQLNLWLSYKDYLRESQNDAFNWRAGYDTSAALFRLEHWQIDLGIGGQHYTSGSPGTTEENFGYLFADFALVRPIEIDSGKELSLEPGYQIKSYSDLSGRVDHRLNFLSTLVMILNSRHKLSPFAELGMISSSDGIYSRSYFAIGADWVFQTRPDVLVGAGVYLRHAVYPNRTVSARTVVSSRRNSFRTLSVDEKESQTYNQVQGIVTKKFESFDLKGLGYAASQTSKSGFENYTEFGAGTSAVITF